MNPATKEKPVKTHGPPVKPARCRLLGRPTRAGVLVTTFATAAILLGNASPIQAAIFEEDFESYASPTSLQGGTAASPPWNDPLQPGNANGDYSFFRQVSARALDEVYPGDGTHTIPVSPFGPAGDTMVMEHYDDHQTRFPQPQVNVNPTSGQFPLTLKMDFRIDSRWDPDDGSSTSQDGTIDEGRLRLILQEDLPAPGDNGLYLNMVTTSGANEFEMAWVDFSSTPQFLVELKQERWYQMELEIEEPDGTNSTDVIISVEEWVDGDPNSTTVLSPTTIQLRQPSSQFDVMKIMGSNSTNESHVYVDNIKLSPVPEPGSIALLAAGGLICLRRRR